MLLGKLLLCTLTHISYIDALVVVSMYKLREVGIDIRTV